MAKNTSTRPAQTDNQFRDEQVDLSTSFAWRYMQNMVAPFAEKVERAAQNLTATATYIPTVTSKEFSQVMQAKNQLLQVLCVAKLAN